MSEKKSKYKTVDEIFDYFASYDDNRDLAGRKSTAWLNRTNFKKALAMYNRIQKNKKEFKN